MSGIIIRNTLSDNIERVYVGGDFSAYKGVSTPSGSIRLNTDGTRDTTFNTGTGPEGFSANVVYSSTIDSNGKIYVMGGFGSYNGTTVNSIIRLNPDGTRDTGFDMGTGFDNQITTCVIDSNGKLYIGGNFYTYKDVAAAGIIRLNPDGTRDTGFDMGSGVLNTVATPDVYAIVIDSNGKIYVGGDFVQYKNSGETENGIIRLNSDGSKDTAFDNSTGFFGYDTVSGEPENNDWWPAVYCLALDSNGKLYVGGGFVTYKGVTVNSIIRLNPDGTRDTGFDMGTGFGPPALNQFQSGAPVRTIKIDNNGKIYVGGEFTSYRGTTANGIIRLNPDGTKDTGFDNSTGFSGGGVYALALDSNGKIYVGGTFTSYKGVAANSIIRLNPDGSKDTTFDNTTGFGGGYVGSPNINTFAISSGIRQSPIIISPAGTNRIIVT